MHWSITDQPPNSDRIWAQWKTVAQPSFTQKTATAECDELSALFAFLVSVPASKASASFGLSQSHSRRLVPSSRNNAVIRVVVPTSQIFLAEDDTFDTRKVRSWHQKTIYDYTRHDVPDSFEAPRSPLRFFPSPARKIRRGIHRSPPTNS